MFVTNKGYIQHNQVSQSAELELAFDVYDFNCDNLDEVFAKMSKIGINISPGKTSEISVLNDLQQR